MSSNDPLRTQFITTPDSAGLPRAPVAPPNPYEDYRLLERLEYDGAMWHDLGMTKMQDEGPGAARDERLQVGNAGATKRIIEEFRCRFPNTPAQGDLQPADYKRLRDMIVDDPDMSLRFAGIALMDHLAESDIMSVDEMCRSFVTLKVLMNDPKAFVACGDIPESSTESICQRAFEATATIMLKVEERGTFDDLTRMIQRADAEIAQFSGISD